MCLGAVGEKSWTLDLKGVEPRTLKLNLRRKSDKLFGNSCLRRENCALVFNEMKTKSTRIAKRYQSIIASVKTHFIVVINTVNKRVNRTTHCFAGRKNKKVLGSQSNHIISWTIDIQNYTHERNNLIFQFTKWL